MLKLQKQKKTKVVRVSGCSIGSLLALLYIVNIEKELDIDINNIFKKGIAGFKEKYNFLYVLSKGGNTVTANINVTFALATISFFAFIGAGIKKYGFMQHWKNLAPSGLPWPLYFVVVPIEFMGLFIRPLALTLRLAGNMMGGHIALVIFITFIFSANAELGAFAGFAIAPFSVALALGLTMLELLVAVIQAYVFALLTAVFIGMAIHVDH